MIVTTVDDHVREFIPADFFEWSEGVHKPIKAIEFGTLAKDKQHRINVSFRNASRNLDFESAVAWSLRGEEQTVQSFDTALLGISDSIKQPFSPVFGAGTIQTMVFNIATLGAGIIASMFILFPMLDRLRSAAIPTQMDFRFPDGRIAHAYPLEPVSPSPVQSGSQALHSLPYIVLTLAIMAHLLRRMFAVGVFNFGFDRRAVSRSLDLRAKIVWGGVVAAVIAVAAPIVLELLGL